MMMEYSFEDVLTIRNGRNQKAVENPNGKYPIYGSGGIMGYADDFICSGDTVIIGRKGNINNPIYVSEPFWNVDTAFGLESKNDLLNPRYLFYFCKRFDFEKLNKTVTIPSLTKSDLLKIRLNVPELSIQEEIVSKLVKLEKIVQLRLNELQKLDELVKARFVELFGDPKANDKGFTKAPMGEYMTVLTDFSSNGSYKTLDSGVTMYDEPNYAWMVRTTDLESGDMSSIKYIDENAYELLSKSKIYGGEIIMNKIGSAGKVYLMPEIEMPASLGRNAFMFRYDDRINVRFLFEQLVSEYGQAEIQQYVRGAVTKTITKDDARSVQIIVPEKELQDKYAEFVHQIDKSKVVVPSKIKNAIFVIMLSVSFGQITSI